MNQEVKVAINRTILSVHDLMESAWEAINRGDLATARTQSNQASIFLSAVVSRLDTEIALTPSRVANNRGPGGGE